MSSRIRTVLGRMSAVTIAAAMMAAVTSSAQASMLTATATNCAAPKDAQVFLPWGDPSEYFMAPDGNFATSLTGWSLSGGAASVPGGDGYSLSGAHPSTASLALPVGSSATTPAICVGIGEPTIRFFARNTGAATSTLLVNATVMTTLGGNLTVPVGVVSASASWRPTTVQPLIVSLLPLLPGNLTPITLSFSALGHGGNWQIDDVYVDPWTRGE